MQIMAFALKVPTNIFRQENLASLSGGRRRTSVTLGKQRSLIPLLCMSNTPTQCLEKTSTGSQNMGLPILVNGCTGKMGKAVIEAAVSAGLHLIPFSFSSAEESGKTVQVCGKEIQVHGPSERESILSSVFDEYPDLIVVDYTVPAAVNDNANLYCKIGVPFVMGTTGGDREQLYKTVGESKVYAVISPQMGKQVVAFLAAMEIMAEQFPGAFSGYSLQVMESHQAGKLDTSGTAKAVISCFQKLGVSFEMDQVQNIRDPKQQIEMVGVPEEYLAGHAFHMYHLTSPDQTVSFEFQHNVCGRSIYAEGTVDAAIFLAKKVQSKADKRIYNMIDVLREVVLRSSSVFWPPQVVEALKALSGGPHHSKVDSGEVLFVAISDLRHSLSLSSHRLASSAADGYALFFDQLMLRAESAKWFGEVVPALATLLLQLPSLLETHYQNADGLVNGGRDGVKTGLRILGPQEAGIVFLSQELIGAILACSFFCLFPITNRGAKHLPTINFDHLFAGLYDSYSETLENKIKCIIHYFERICSSMPVGFVSFERKVLPLESSSLQVSYPKADFWSESVVPLCHFQVYSSGLIEDQSSGALEVDFANKYLGGGALHRGCVQEEIRFMINPELIAGMLFLPSMSDNEAIEIIGTERFSNYKGYASTFRFAGDYVDEREVDFMGRRKTRIIAIDALCSPRMRQYKLDFLLRYAKFFL
ncbi:hypothetical protein L1049_017399 [Liquidambar formosana]|uniref:4-hydroxy-tetrahydrodipicolinate reductase n=1 Tax=Liquidambar formosana TaxID=63359 RepID=A0AAP0S3W2_LIQFO